MPYIFLNISFHHFFLCSYVCLCMDMCAWVLHSQEYQNRASNSLESELQGVELWTELRSLLRAVCTLKHQSISPAPTLYILRKMYQQPVEGMWKDREIMRAFKGKETPYLGVWSLPNCWVRKSSYSKTNTRCEGHWLQINIPFLYKYFMLK